MESSQTIKSDSVKKGITKKEIVRQMHDALLRSGIKLDSKANEKKLNIWANHVI